MAGWRVKDLPVFYVIMGFFLHSDTICGTRTCGIGTMAWERPSTGPGKTARKTVEAVCREVGCLRVK